MTPEEDIARLHAALMTMNGVTLHQTDRLPWQKPSGWGIKSNVHPLTCGNNSSHTPLYPLYEDGRVKLVCRDCDYTQDNAGPIG